MVSFHSAPQEPCLRECESAKYQQIYAGPSLAALPSYAERLSSGYMQTYIASVLAGPAAAAAAAAAGLSIDRETDLELKG
jgi:hypothetical protein